MDALLKRFTEILCGTLDNKAQVESQKSTGKQVHPYAKHVTAICDHKIVNRPEHHPGAYILEESYYQYPNKGELDIKPLLFYLQSDGDKKIFLQSIKIPETLKKEEVTNDNDACTLDFNDLEPTPFGTAEYTLQETGQFTVNHIADMGNGITFQLTETLSTDGLLVLETVRKEGVKLTPYDTPIEYRNVQL